MGGYLPEGVKSRYNLSWVGVSGSCAGEVGRYCQWHARLSKNCQGALMLLPGDPAPYFKAASSVNPKFNFDSVAGRKVVLCFFGSLKHADSERLLREIANHEDRFDV